MILEVEIKNWTKYNPRSDVKSCSWFRMSNDFFMDPDFYGCSISARISWIFLLSMASKKMAQVVRINTNMMIDSLKITQDALNDALNELENTGSIVIIYGSVKSTRSDPIVTSMLPSATNERTDERTNEEASETFKMDELTNSWNEAAISSYLKACPLALGGAALGLALKIYPTLSKNKMSWKDYFHILASSEFLKNKTGGPVTIMWALNEQNFEKVIVGSFDNEKKEDLSWKSFFES